MTKLIDRLRHERKLDYDGYLRLLNSLDDRLLSYAMSAARETADIIFGKQIYLRGLIEISNRCRNSCLYCGLRKENAEIDRYRMSEDEILETCRYGYGKGFRTFVLQGGEDPSFSEKQVTALICRIHRDFPDAAITLSLGEWGFKALEKFRKAGADRYLLRHETADSGHFRMLHNPPSPEKGRPLSSSFRPNASESRHKQTLEDRLKCISMLKEAGYQTGMGMMIGSPYQKVGFIAEDLLLIQEMKPEMIGVGPFIPQHDTPFAGFPCGSIEMTLFVIALLRLMSPHALIPSTTALSSLSEKGRKSGILAGANVVMPNITPLRYRTKYVIYDHKAVLGAESGESLNELRKEMEDIGYSISFSRGDYGGSEKGDHEYV